MHKLAASGKLLFVLVSLVPFCACFVGQGNTGSQQHAQTGMSITKSSATAEDLVYSTPKTKQEHIKAMQLSAPMSQALRRYAVAFNLWSLVDYPPEQIRNYPYSKKSIPYAVKGDFNGDGTEDAVVAGHDQESNLILAILSNKADYHILTVKEDKYYTAARKQGKEIPYTPTEALVLRKAGTRLSEGDINASITVLKTEAFSVKGIRRFDRDRHTFRQGCTGIDTYEYAGKFSARYLELTAKSTSSVSELRFKPEQLKESSLPGRISDVLHAYNKDFVLWKIEDYSGDKITAYPYSEKSLPYRVEGDFNNDGQEDLVLAGHDKDSNITVALMSSATSYSPLVISEFPCYKLARKHHKKLEYVPTDSIELQNRTGDEFILRQINTWGLVDTTDDYSDDYKLTGLSGNLISYKYSEKFFKHSGPEDECIDKGFGTPW